MNIEPAKLIEFKIRTISYSLKSNFPLTLQN